MPLQRTHHLQAPPPTLRVQGLLRTAQQARHASLVKHPCPLCITLSTSLSLASEIREPTVTASLSVASRSCTQARPIRHWTFKRPAAFSVPPVRFLLLHYSSSGGTIKPRHQGDTSPALLRRSLVSLRRYWLESATQDAHDRCSPVPKWHQHPPQSATLRRTLFQPPWPPDIARRHLRTLFSTIQVTAPIIFLATSRLGSLSSLSLQNQTSASSRGPLTRPLHLSTPIPPRQPRLLSQTQSGANHSPLQLRHWHCDSRPTLPSLQVTLTSLSPVKDSPVLVLSTALHSTTNRCFSRHHRHPTLRKYSLIFLPFPRRFCFRLSRSCCVVDGDGFQPSFSTCPCTKRF